MTNSELSNQSLIELEHSLKEYLNPVKPDQNFIGQLLQRLENSSSNPVQRKMARKLLRIALAFSVGFIVFLLGKKLVDK
jgi:hypothetical protein